MSTVGTSVCVTAGRPWHDQSRSLVRTAEYQQNGCEPVYVVSQFASAANRRLEHLLAMDSYGYKTVLVRQAVRVGTERLINHSTIEAVRKPPNPLGLLDRVGLGRTRERLDRRMWFPTPTVLYARAAEQWLWTRIGNDLLEGKRPSVVLSTPPHDLSVIAPGLRRRFPHLNVIIDWQDLWSDDVVYLSRTHPKWKDRVRTTERRAAQAASTNVVSNPKSAERLRKILGAPEASGKALIVTAIPHAFDDAEESTAEAVFEERAARTKSWPRRLKLSFVGNLFKPPRVPGDRLIAALAAVRRDAMDLELTVIGCKTLERAPERVRDCGFPVTALERQPHLDAMQIAGRSDWLVLLLGKTETSDVVMPAKLPAYLILGVPILAIAPHNSYVSDVIKATGSGVVIDPESNLEAEVGRVLTQPFSVRTRFSEVAAAARDFDMRHQHVLWRAVLDRSN